MNGVLEKVVAEQPHDSTRNHENVAILSNIRDVPAVLDPFFSAGAGCVREWQRFVKRDDGGAGGVASRSGHEQCYCCRSCHVVFI